MKNFKNSILVAAICLALGIFASTQGLIDTSSLNLKDLSLWSVAEAEGPPLDCYAYSTNSPCIFDDDTCSFWSPGYSTYIRCDYEKRVYF